MSYLYLWNEPAKSRLFVGHGAERLPSSPDTCPPETINADTYPPYLPQLAVIRPVLEFVPSLAYQSYKATDYIAGKHSTPRTTQIIAGNIPYKEACCLFKLTSLSERRDSLCSKLFRQLVSQSHILHWLLPAQRDDSLTGRLRSRNKYLTVRARTNRFKNSFIPYTVANYQ